MEKKTYTAAAEVKDAEQGLVQADFATLKVMDLDGDVTLPGAFGDQRVKLAAWGHNWGDLPVGKGAISERGEKAVFDGQFFLDTMSGQEHFKTVRNLGALQEWSYGFEVKKAAWRGETGFDDLLAQHYKGPKPDLVQRILQKMDVFEVSPVMRGAGVGTRTTMVKADKTAIAPHRTDKAPEETSWSALTLTEFTSEAWEELSDAEKRKIAGHFAWSRALPPETFGDLKLGHHLASNGAVVWRGVANAAARLNQADIPGDDMEGVRRHLAGHYRQFDREPPWASTRGWQLTDHADYLLEEVQALLERCQSFTGELEEEGRLLSGAKRERLVRLADLTHSVGDEVKGLLEKTAQPASEKALAAFSEYQRIAAVCERLGIVVEEAP